MNKTQLKAAMLEDLRRSNLTEEDAKTLQLSTADHKLTPAVAGYTIPYFDVNGKKTKFYRVRYVEDTATGFAALAGRKSLRYSQPPNSVNEVYLAPYIDWAAYLAGKLPLNITEGEKKSALATRDGIPTIGLGGVWSFMSKRAEAALLPIFNQINLMDRLVYICFDSDAATNPDILHAEATLAKRLLEKGARVFIARIPPQKNTKVGIDDYIVKYSAAKFEVNILRNAFEYSASKVLHMMNTELVYLRDMSTIYDRKHNMLISPRDFTFHTHSNITLEVLTHEHTPRLVTKKAAPLWLEWKHRAELSGITYAPGADKLVDNKINKWPGWGIQNPAKGDVSPWHALLDWLFAGSDAAARVWFERWCAYPLQYPGCKMATAVVIWGATQGTGKTLCGHTLMRLYGSNATEVKDSDLEDARFTWAENKQFVLADDITGQNNRKLANMFKTMITQKTIHINQKYVPSYTVPDRINYYFTSNDPDAFYLDEGDRRFFIHEVLSGGLPEDLRKRYVKWRDSDVGMQHLFYYLLNLPLGNFDPQAPALVTGAKREMTSISKSEIGAFVEHLMEAPSSAPFNKLNGDLVTADELHMLFDPLGTKKGSANAIARELKRCGFHKIQNPSGGAIRIGDRQLRVYAIRNREKWRNASVKSVTEHYIEHHMPAKDKF